MKKVGILTYHRSRNYGAVIQCFSLVNRLKLDHPDCKYEVIDYTTVSDEKYYYKAVIRAAIKDSFASAFGEIKRNRQIRRFSKSLPLTDWHIISNNAEKLFAKIRGKYDLIIVGSDAVFSWSNKKFPIAYLLKEECGCPKMSYAASAHSMKYHDSVSEQIVYSMKAFESFDYIGVRDRETEKFVNYCSNKVKVHHNCDPTVLLDMTMIDYEEIRVKLEAYGVNTKKPTIIVMTASEIVVSPIYEKYKYTHQFLSVYVRNPLITKHIADLFPLEWAGIFRFADLTITEYFHGTLLSLKNNTPVISFDRTDYTKGYEGKIRDLLVGRLDLGEMYFNFRELGSEECTAKMHTIADKATRHAYVNILSTVLAKEAESYTSFNDCLSRILYK